MGKVGPPKPGTVKAAALEAVEAEKVARGEGLTSLNKLLQWATANTAKTEDRSGNLDAETLKQRVSDREWMEAFFPDMFQPVKILVELLKDENNTDVEKKVEVLEALEEYMQDLNYAANVDKIGALDPVMEAAGDTGHVNVQVAALWVLGTCMQDLEEVKEVFMEKDGCKLLVAALSSEDEKVRAKAVMATSALLRNSKEVIKTKFRELGGADPLFKLLSDEAARVRRRVLFFLENCSANGNEWFARMVLDDQSTLNAIVDRLDYANPQDPSELEPLIGAMTGLANVQLSIVKNTRAPQIFAKLIKDIGDPTTRSLAAALDTRLATP